MNMKQLLTLVAFFATLHASAQQVNPVPDYVFANRMSAGRNTVTDTAAYFSIGPRYGATRGMMPPMVVDTASFSANKRNGLLIFSIQKNKFLYWDSVGVKWAEMAGTGGTAISSGDTAAMLAPYLRKADTTAMLSKYLRKSDTATLSNRINLKLNISDTSTMLTPYVRHAGYGLTKSGQSFIADTLNLSTRSWRQKGIDSIAAIRIGGSGTTNYISKFTASGTIGNSQIFDNGTSVGINAAVPSYRLDVRANANDIANFQTSVGGGGFIRFSDANTATVTKIGAVGDQLHLVANDSVRVRVASDGNILIGTLNNNARLTVFSPRSSNVAAFSSPGGGGAYISFGDDNTTGAVQLGALANSLTFRTSATERGRFNAGGELILDASGTDAGDYKLQVVGNSFFNGNIRTAAPTGGTANDWRLGTVATVSPTSPNRTIEVSIGGTIYYIAAKTTND